MVTIGAHVVRPSPCGACCGGICGKAHHCGTMQASSPTNHVQRSQHTARQNSSAVAFTPILYKGKYAFQHAEKRSDLYFPVNGALHFYVMLRQHRTIPALRLKHRSGGCGTASAAPRSPYRHLELCGIALYFPVNRALHFYVMLTKPAKTGELNASCRAAFESNIILL